MSLRFGVSSQTAICLMNAIVYLKYSFFVIDSIVNVMTFSEINIASFFILQFFNLFFLFLSLLFIIWLINSYYDSADPLNIFLKFWKTIRHFSNLHLDEDKQSTVILSLIEDQAIFHKINKYSSSIFWGYLVQ